MQLEQILSAAVAAVNQDDFTTFTTTTSTTTTGIPSPALPPQDSPTPPSAALHSRAPPPATTPPPFKTDLAEGGLGEVSFFPLDDDNLVITSQQALAMFEAPPAPPQRPPPLNTPPILPPPPITPPQYYTHPSYSPAAPKGEVVVKVRPGGEKTFTELEVTDRTVFGEAQGAATTFTEVGVAGETFPKLPAGEKTLVELRGAEGPFTEVHAAHTTFAELPVEEKALIEVQGAEATFPEVQESEKTFIEVQRAEDAFPEVQESEKTFIEVQGAEATFSQVQESEKTFIEVRRAEETFAAVQETEAPTFTELSVAEGMFTEVPGFTTVPITEVGTTGGLPEVVFPDTAFCGVPVGEAQYTGVPLTEVTLGDGEEGGVPAVSAEVEVLTSEDSPQYTSLTPATPTHPPAAPPVVVRVAGPGLNLAVPNTFMSTPLDDLSPPQPPPQPPTPPPSRPPEHSHVLEALRASIFRSRARKRAAPPTEREGETGRRRKKRRAPPTSPRPPTPPPEPWEGEGDDLRPAPPPEDDGVQVQLVYLVYPVDPSTGSVSQIMLSEALMNRGQQNASPLSTPTAPRKSFDMDTSQQGTSEYKNKLMAQWAYDDIVQFFMDSPWGFQSKATKDIDFNFTAINGATGPELMRFTREKFLEFSPKHGDEIYEYMQRKVAHERERERAEAPLLYSPSIHSPPSSSFSIPSPSLSTSTSTSSSPFSPSSLDPLHSRLPLHHHPQPSLVCDAPARYELRFEPPPQPRPRYQGGEGGGDVYNLTPTAARKSLSLLPPLEALEGGGREREERRERVSDAAGEGRSGEQGRPAEEEVKVEPPKKRGPGRPRKPENELKKKKKKTGRLWEFIRNLLLDPETCPSLVKWENAEEGLFRFMDAEKVARRWGDRKQNREMNYEKLSRAMRYYYKTHIFEAVIGRRLVYKFGKNAKGWKPKNPNFPDIHNNLSTHRDPPPPPQPPPPPPIHHHTDSTPTIHLHTDAAPPLHLHSDSAPSLHHLSDSAPSMHHHTDHTSQLHHHSDPSPPQPPPIHHHHQPESQHLLQYQSESPPPQISVHQGNTTPPPPPLSHHLHHPHTLQNLTLHHHQLQPHHTT